MNIYLLTIVDSSFFKTHCFFFKQHAIEAAMNIIKEQINNPDFSQRDEIIELINSKKYREANQLYNHISYELYNEEHNIIYLYEQSVNDKGTNIDLNICPVIDSLL